MLRNLQRIHFLDAERVEGDSVQFVVRVEESQHVALGPNDLVQPLHHGAQQHRVQILQSVIDTGTVRTGGDVFVSAQSIAIQGGADGSRSGIFTQAGFSTGNAGNITLDGGSLTVVGSGGAIESQSSSFGNGSAGNIKLSLNSLILCEGMI